MQCRPNPNPFRSKLLVLAALALLAGCTRGMRVLPPDQQTIVDRHITEYPNGFVLRPYVTGLNSPTSMAFDDAHNLIIAENGRGGDDPHIFGIRPNGTRFEIYPVGTRIPVFNPGFRIYAPIGGILPYKGRIYVSHRDSDDMGVITSFGYDGNHSTLVAGLPAQGDFAVTDMAISPINDRIYFGLGTVTNSGVVGLDNWAEGWVRKHPQACDIPLTPLKLLGYRFDVPNPLASLFAPQIVVTVPYCPLGVSDVTLIPASPDHPPKPTGAIFSVSPGGGDLRVEAWGVHDPVGLAFNEFGRLYFTDRGMELRGTRPIANDPDVLWRLVEGANYFWPDFSRSCEPIGLKKFQPPESMVINTGYPEVNFVIDHAASNLSDPDPRWISGLFKSLSGAAKMDLFPSTGPFRDYRGSLVVALWGDRAPFATNGLRLKFPLPGYRLVRVDPDSHTVDDFVFNVEGGPASSLSDGQNQAIERPIDVKFGPDGFLYILDYGRIRMKDGHEKDYSGTGKIFRLMPVNSSVPSTRP